MMWLINTSTLELREFSRSTPSYATFSYVTDENEASFEGLAQAQKDRCNDSIKTIERACDQARIAGYEWLWNHAACVDKRSCAAQSEAINSLPRIYRDCEHSIVYLEDLYYDQFEDEQIVERLAACRWIKNIWAIPQIVFPREVYFYSSDWSQIGTKRSLLPHLSSIIGIDQPALEHWGCLEDYSIARRMSWASEMTAFRTEDLAYALLGLFDVGMPIIYGEGGKAFLKLQEEIIRDTDDFSLLAWDNFDGRECNGLFAYSPACFRRFRNGPTTPFSISGEAQIHCTGITIQTSFLKTRAGLFLPMEGQDGSTCCIPLCQWDGRFVRGSQVEWNLSGPMILDNRRICVKRDVSAHLSEKINACGGFARDGSCEPLDESGTARASRCSLMDYNSNDGTGSNAPSVDDCGMTSQSAPSEFLSEVTSQEDPIAWSVHDRGSVEGTLRIFDSDVRPLWVREIASQVHHSPEGFPVDVAGEAGIQSPCSDSAGDEVNDESQNSMHTNGSPPTEAQVLDVAQVTKELGDIAVEQFLSGGQRQCNKRSFIPWKNQTRKRPKLMQSPEQLEIVHTSDSEDGETVLVRKARFFACPFYVRNNNYTKCVTRHHLQSIEEVKEHVCWEHRRPMFCPVCKEEFGSSRDRDAHIRLRICHANISTTPEGITDDQEEQLNGEEESSLSDDSRWFQIWDIIFPDVDRPSSTLYTGEREASVSSFRQFWIQSGEEIVAAFLEQKRCQSYNIRNEERKLQEIYDLVMEKVVDRIFTDLSNSTGKY